MSLFSSHFVKTSQKIQNLYIMMKKVAFFWVITPRKSSIIFIIQ